MLTNNTVHPKDVVSDNRKVGAIIMPIIAHRSPDNGTGGGQAAAKPNLDDINLDAVIDDNRREEPPKTPPIVPPTTPPTETAEEKAARETNEAKAKADGELAAKFGGVKLAENGDVLDSTGKVVKTKAEVDAANVPPPAPEAVEIDGVKYALDKDGNALDKDNKVFKTKAEIDALASEPPALVDEVIQKTGIHPVGADGKPKVYEDSVDGLIQLNNDIAEHKAKQAANDLFKAFPKVEKYLKHVMAGGDDAKFFNVVKDDWKKVTIDEKNVDQQKNILKSNLLAKGFTVEKADKYIQRAFDANELLQESQDALKENQTKQKEAEAKLDADNAQALKDEEARVTQHWKAVEEVVTAGKLKDIVIPEVDRKAFYEYVAMAADDNGNSKAALDRANEDLEMRLLFDFYRFKKYSFKTLIQNAAASATVLKLRDRINKSKGVGSVGAPPKDEPTTAATDISLEKLIPN